MLNTRLDATDVTYTRPVIDQFISKIAKTVIRSWRIRARSFARHVGIVALVYVNA